MPELWCDVYGCRVHRCGSGYNGREVSACYEELNERYTKRVLAEFLDVWYRPDSEKFEICVYTPDGNRRYDRHAVQRIEFWYDD